MNFAFAGRKIGGPPVSFTMSFHAIERVGRAGFFTLTRQGE
jgi:hypothetical protein